MSPEDREATYEIARLLALAVSDATSVDLVRMCDRVARSILLLVQRHATPPAMRQPVPVLREIERKALTNAIRILTDSGQAGEVWVLSQLLARSVTEDRSPGGG